MTTEHEFRQQITQGQEARMLLENPALQAAFHFIEKETYDLWQASPNQETREQLWMRLRGMQLFRMRLESLINGEKIAQAELTRRRTRESSSGSPDSKTSPE